MKMCTGARFAHEAQQNAAIDGWHGRFGHLDLRTLDHDDIVTHYGRHDRVVAFEPRFAPELGKVAAYVRVDHVWGLGMPGEREIADVLRRENGPGSRGRWRIVKAEQHEDGSATDVYLTRY